VSIFLVGRGGDILDRATGSFGEAIAARFARQSTR
jgi:hypothetical protein